MLVLGVETSTAVTSVCLGTERGTVAATTIARPAAHAELLGPAITWCLAQARTDLDAIGGVAVSLGPGLYTGMRVGIASVQALAHARRLPCVGLASLDLLAFRVRHARRPIASVIDARRGELFWAFYRAAPGGVQRLSEFRVGPATKLAGEIEAMSDDVLCIGDGAVANRSLLESTGADVGSPIDAHPRAEALVELALPRFVREDTQRPEDLGPVYLRQPDAAISWRHRGALVGGKAPAGRAPRPGPDGASGTEAASGGGAVW